MSTLFQDVRITLRQLVRRPSLAGFAVLSLALGIGASTTIFSIVNAFLLKGLEEPGPRADRLLEIYSGKPDSPYGFSSYPNYLDLEQRADFLSHLGARLTVQAVHVGEGLVQGEAVSRNLLRLYGLDPALGRDFQDDDTAVVLLGYGFWQRRFGGDPEVLGRRLQFNGQELEVVGVAPKELRGAFPGFPTDFWTPIEMHRALTGAPLLEMRQAGALMLTGCLRPEVTVAEAKSRLEALAKGLRAEHPQANEDLRFSAVASREVIFMPGVDEFFFKTARRLLLTVALVLLIACSNLANLLLARNADRRREIATRLALGSSRLRLVRLLVAEGVVLAVPAGVLGWLMALVSAPLVQAMQPAFPIPLVLDLEPDLRVFAFTFGVALLSGVICGLIPALRASRPELVSALKDTDGQSVGRFNLRGLLTASQVALSTVLLVGAGLFLRSFVHASSLDPGFSERRGVTAKVALGLGQYGEGRRPELFREILEQVREVPGVRSAAWAQHLPLMPPSSGYRRRSIHTDAGATDKTLYTRIGSGYFETLGVPLLMGRDFSPADGEAAPGVVIVNEAAARQFWPDVSPLGRRLRLGEAKPWLDVVGVARDGRYKTLGEDEPRPFVYLPQAQHTSGDMILAVATAAGDGDTLGRVRDALHAFDSQLPVYDFKTLEQHLDISLFLPRMGAVLLLICGGLGLVLASAGLFGVVSYSVSRRTREIAVRMALGARRGDVVRLIVRQGTALVTMGVAVGLAVAWAGSGKLGPLSPWGDQGGETLLYGVTARDPWTYLAVSLVLAAVTLAANLLPARRAASVEPVRALRSL